MKHTAEFENLVDAAQKARDLLAGQQRREIVTVHSLKGVRCK
jgi:hypothetical protein